MARLGLETKLVDGEVYKRTLMRFREAGVVLPKFAELKDPSTIPQAISERLADIDPDAFVYFVRTVRLGLMLQRAAGLPAPAGGGWEDLIARIVAGFGQPNPHDDATCSTMGEP